MPIHSHNSKQHWWRFWPKGLEYKLNHGTWLQPSKIEVFANKNGMFYDEQLECMDMGQDLGKYIFWSSLQQYFLGVSSCCPFSPAKSPLKSQVGPRICCAWRVGSTSWRRWNQGKRFSSEWWRPFQQSLNNLPSGKLTCSYWTWPIYSWFTH